MATAPTASPRVPPSLARILPVLRCPVTGQELHLRADGDLQTADGRRVYPVVDGVPVLLAADQSLFDPADYRAARPPRRSAVGRAARLLGVPVRMTSRNVGSDENYRELVRLLCRRPRRRVLVVGGAVAGRGFDELLHETTLEIIETDVVIGPRTAVVCDGHDLPFDFGAFDAVVCQGVLQFVLDPARVVSEFHRVLADDGLVYSETPFMQHVMNGPADFTRWTEAGHLRLFRDFEPLRRGVHNGPGMMLAWSLRYFLTSFAGSSRVGRAVLNRVGALLGFWLPWLDGFLERRPAAADAASGTFLLARRRATPIADTAILAAYRGTVPAPSELVL